MTFTDEVEYVKERTNSGLSLMRSMSSTLTKTTYKLLRLLCLQSVRHLLTTQQWHLCHVRIATRRLLCLQSVRHLLTAQQWHLCHVRIATRIPWNLNITLSCARLLMPRCTKLGAPQAKPQLPSANDKDRTSCGHAGCHGSKPPGTTVTRYSFFSGRHAGSSTGRR